jgi:hypothetical protein
MGKMQKFVFIGKKIQIGRYGEKVKMNANEKKINLKMNGWGRHYLYFYL